MRIAETFVEVQMRLEDSSVRRAQSSVKAAATRIERDAKIPVTVDDRKLGESLGNAERSVSSTARQMAATFATLFTAKVAIDFFRDAIDGASKLEQAVGGSEQVFGEMAGELRGFAEGADSALGLSEEAALRLTTSLGGLMQNLGLTRSEAVRWSQELTTTGADLAAAFGGTTEEAVSAIGSALRGEYDSLERWNVSLRESTVAAKAVELGLADSTSEVDSAARAHAALALITEQGATVAGQFGRESDTAAGQAQILAAELANQRAELGDRLLPIYGQALNMLEGLLGIFGKLPAPVQTAVVAMAGLAAIAAPIANLTRGMGGLASILGKVGGAGGPLTLLAVGVGAALLAVQQFGAEERELDKWSDEVATSLANQWQETFRVALESEGAEGAVAGLAAANKALTDALTNSGEGGEELTQSLGALGLQTGDLLTIMARFRTMDAESALYHTATQAGLTGEELFVVGNAALRASETGGQLAGHMIDLAMSLNKTEAEAVAMYGELYPAAEALENLQNKANSDVLDQAATKALNAAAAVSEEADQLIRKAEAQTGATRAGEDSLLVYQKFGQLLGEADQATQDAILGTDEFAAAQDALAAATEAAGKTLGAAAPEAKALSDALESTKTKAELAAEGAAAAAEKIKGVGDEATAAESGLAEMADVTSELSDGLDDSASAADRLRQAIAKVVGPGDDLRETTRAVHKELQGLVGALDENGNSFDATTEAGRANQEQMEATRDAILAHGAALIRNGESAETAAGDIAFNTESLREQLRQADLTEAEIDALIATYNLTPSDISTILRLEGEAFANEVVARYNSKLDSIPESEATAIQALIDEGNYAEANRRLDALENPRTVPLRVSVNNPVIRTVGTGSRLTVQATPYAEGGWVDRDQLAFVHRGEVVVNPSGPRSRIRELLGDQRADPIAAAVGGDTTTNVAGGLSIGSITVGSRDDLGEVVSTIDELGWRLRVGARS